MRNLSQISQELFLRKLVIGGLSVIASIGLADRANATYFIDGARASTYIDKELYHLLDDGQYHYLDRGQYNVRGELGYLLGHSYYPKLFERELNQAVGFMNRVSTAGFSVRGGQVPISEYIILSSYYKAGDDIDRRRYYFLDKEQYYYLERGQYDLFGGLGYSFERSEGGIAKVVATPEPSTIGFLGLGALVILVLKR